MNITYSKVRDPKWANLERSMISCIVKFDHMKSEAEFGASPNDSMAHGRKIFADCLAGKYGPIADFVEPPTGDQPRAGSSNGAEPVLLDWPDMMNFLDEANRENASGTIRGQVLVWSSMIELLVSRLVEAFMVNHKIAKELFDGPSFTFSMQIDLAFSLGLISKSEHRTCHKVREIRNQVAHNWEFTLQEPRVKSAFKSLYDSDHAELLEWIEDIEFLVKMIYCGSCADLAFRLAGRRETALDERRLQRPDS